MKILWFYCYDPRHNYDHWLHMGFAESLKIYSGAQVKCYGHRLHEVYPEFVVMPWKETITMKDIKKEFDFDIVILNTKSRMFTAYIPPIKPGNLPHSHSPTWMPKDFNEYNCPKVVIEEDYHWETDDDWYAKVNIDLIIQRHLSQTLRKGKVKSIWLPFSVDTSIFKPNENIIERDPRICYMGGDSVCYIYRKRVKTILMYSNLGLNFMVDFHNRHRDERYVKTLQNFRAFLSGSSTVNHTPAKMFEIMSSGGLLWTNNNKLDKYGLRQLFPDDIYITYEEDFSDVVEKSGKIVLNKDWAETIARKGMEYVRANHNHQVRIKQLMDILNKEFGLKI